MENNKEKKCKNEGCKRPYRAKGYCTVHYKKWRHGELAHPRYKTCVSEGCRKPRKLGSLCTEHAGIKTEEAPKKAPAPAAETPAT
ncbi:MAG: vegetative protein [Deltaproteobacteria bacterium]|nr:vegetative protein [Deltaproteobacteria bacterium]